MKICCLSDREAKTVLFEDLRGKVFGLIAGKGHTIKTVELDRDATSACTGCLQCWTRQNAECVCRDTIGDLTRNKLDCGLVFYLTPVVFGTFNSTIKNAMDRGELLFRDPNRRQIVIGYGEDTDDEEKSTFIDLIARHRGSADIVHPKQKESIQVFVSRSAEDNDAICSRIQDAL